jgi:hypothetical protein
MSFFFYQLLKGSAFQAGVLNTLTFSPNGLDFRNRRRA